MNPVSIDQLPCLEFEASLAATRRGDSTIEPVTIIVLIVVAKMGRSA